MTIGQLHLTHAIHGHVPLKPAPGTILRRTISHEDIQLQKAFFIDGAAPCFELDATCAHCIMLFTFVVRHLFTCLPVW